MNKYEKSVKSVESVINSDRNEPIELEISVMIQKNDGCQNIYPGIQIHIPGVDMPIFISTGELNLLADVADKYCTDVLERKKKEKKSNKSKSAKT